jgi:hypothetical protein
MSGQRNKRRLRRNLRVGEKAPNQQPLSRMRVVAAAQTSITLLISKISFGKKERDKSENPTISRKMIGYFELIKT